MGKIFFKKEGMYGQDDMYDQMIIHTDILHRNNDNSGLVYSNFQKVLPLQKTINKILKRALDLLVSIVIITGILSWLVPIIACVIKLTSKGPVFFTQKRNKKNGAVFNCIKFRTMIVNKEADEKGAMKNDKRITPVGAFLRSKHLDELPQFFNVLIGDMSFIGPRPHMISENIRNGKIIKSYNTRHNVKPGITGLAQSLGYFGFTEEVEKLNERIKLDLYYINNWSVKMDFQIILKTIKNLFRS